MADPATFWCAGMYASGSTWAYNMLREVAQCLQPGRPVKGRFANTLHDLVGLEDSGTLHVVKSHWVESPVAAVLSRAAGRIVVTIRDPRDAVTSLMAYQRFTFTPALGWVEQSARFCAGLADDARSVVLRYDDGFIDDPTTIDRMAEWLGGSLAAGERERLYAASRREVLEKFIGQLDTMPNAGRHAPSGDVYDNETQWHKHHAGRSGEVGRWRRALTAAQVATVEQALGDWMTRFGYERAPPTAGYTLSVGRMSVSGL